MATEVLVEEHKHGRRAPRGLSSAQAIDAPVGNQATPWQLLCRRFLRHHRSPLNVLLHLVTTPLALLGIYTVVAWASPWLMAGFVTTQVVLLACYAPVSISALHAFVCGGLGLAAYTSDLGLIIGICCFVAGYVLQDLSHWFVNESTYQSSYQDDSHWSERFIQHTLLLLPVLLTLAFRFKQSPFRLMVARKAVLKTKLTAQSQRDDFEQILEWVRGNQTTSDQSTHWWQSDLDDEATEAFNRLSQDPQLIRKIGRFHGAGYSVEPVSGMNEIYLTGPSKQATSDTVFYMGHVDGPWAVFPGARLYRCMLALNQNLEVTTHYPMASLRYGIPEGHRLEHGDAVAFDFNRELHYITRNPDPRQNESRINLKLHFVAYPVRLRWYGNLLAAMTTWYDQRARELFLDTIKPTGWWAVVKTRWLLGWTKVFELAVRFVGWTNLAFLAVVGLVAFLLGDWRIWLVATSFVHYAIYLGTLQERTPVSFGTFQRDAMLFKCVSMLQLFVLYAIGFQSDWGSLLGVFAGFALAGYAAAVLGPTRTLFSSELGLEPPERITRFPYGVIPHPMILGAMLGIASMLGVAQMSEQYSWLIAGHLVAYALVLGQEIRLSRRRLNANSPLSGER